MAARKPKIIPVAELAHMCRECRHVRNKRGDGLYCHRFPPKLVYDPSTGFHEPRWPEVDPQDDCSEFSPPLSS